MNVSSDYFLLYHGLLEVNVSEKSSLKQLPRDTFLELAALLLSTHRKNFNYFHSLNYFKELVFKLCHKTLTTKDDLYLLQSHVLHHLQNKLCYEDLLVLDEAFSYLHESHVLETAQYEKLHTLFNPSLLKTSLDTHSSMTDKPVYDFLEQKELFIKEISHLSELYSSKQFISELHEVQNYINTQKFSIGITGVMNAGKSTLLNALMGEEILGSSVIPETANLSVVKYAVSPSAVVHYWDKKEWQALEESAHNSPSMKKFIQETKNVFDDTLDDYITTPSKQTPIEISDLALYTSAAKSHYKCNLVKFVELGINLKFLADGIEIVDTPGLDDPVVQREEISKEYMSGCDLMIHLMNVSQSATLKDVEFIIDALLYQNVTALLIIITRADTVEEKQLQEVIAYTKKSIKEQLKAINEDHKLDFIFEALTFLSVSGYMALQHRTGKAHHAIEAGFPLERTGILEIESYLNQTLFGSNSSKNRLLIHSISRRIKKAILHAIEALHYELTLVTKSSNELEVELEQFSLQKASDEKHLIQLRSDMKIQKEQLMDYVHTLDDFIQSALMKLQALIKTRLIDDLRYNLENEKQALKHAHVKNILITALKDGIIDIIRDYRNKCLKKMDNITLHITTKYQKSQLKIGSHDDAIDSGELFKETFTSNFLSTNYDQLIARIFDLLHKAKLKKLETTNQELEQVLKEHISRLQSAITDKAHHLTKELLEDFFNKLELPLVELKNKLQGQEILINSHLESSASNEADKEQKALKLHHTIKKLQLVLKGYA